MAVPQLTPLAHAAAGRSVWDTMFQGNVIALFVLADAWGWHHDDVGIGWWLVMMLGMVVFWGAVIALVVWLLRGGLDRRSETPEETLRRRLADGSISIEEYEQRRAALHDPARPPRDPTVGPPKPGIG